MRTTLDPTLDIVFKMLFARPENEGALIDLLTAVLRPRVPIVSAKVQNPEVRREQVNDRGIVLDVLVSFDDGTQVDLEMQATRRPAFPNRALYYWARLYASQLERGQPYTALRPVISVLFLDYVELPTPRFHSEFRVLEVSEHFAFSDALTLHVIELPKCRAAKAAGRPREAPQGDGTLLAWTRFLGAKSDEEVEEACMSNPVIAKTNELLERLSATPSAQELARQRQLALDTYRIEMGAAKEEGREEGREVGREEGRARELRAGILVLAEVLGVEVDEIRLAQLDRSSVEELTTLRDRLRTERHW